MRTFISLLFLSLCTAHPDIWITKNGCTFPKVGDIIMGNPAVADAGNITLADAGRGDPIEELSNQLGSIMVLPGTETAAEYLVQVSMVTLDPTMSNNNLWNQTAGCLQVACKTPPCQLQLDFDKSKPLTVSVASSVGGTAVKISTRTFPVRPATPGEACQSTPAVMACLKAATFKPDANCQTLEFQAECMKSCGAAHIPELKQMCGLMKLTCCDKFGTSASSVLSANWSVLLVGFFGLWVY